MSDKASKVLCIIGSGVQAHSHARVLILARNFQEVWKAPIEQIYIYVIHYRLECGVGHWITSKSVWMTLQL